MCSLGGVGSIAENSKPQVTQNQRKNDKLELRSFGLNWPKGSVGNYRRCG